MERPEWYLNNVKPLQNRKWTPKDRTYLVNLRKKLPAAEVARRMGITLVQVYNESRLAKRKAHNQCFMCGEKLKKKDIGKGYLNLCPECKEKKKKYRKKRRVLAVKKKICIYCEKRKAIPGKHSCRKCISATHRRRYINGLCGACGKHPIRKPGAAFCEICARNNRTKIRIHRKLMKAQVNHAR